MTTGTIFGGLVDVYRLEDGSIILSQRGVVRALTAKGSQGDIGGRDNGNLDPYLARLPKGYNDITVGAIAFIPTHGGTANGVRVEDFSGILAAFASAYQGCGGRPEEGSSGNRLRSYVLASRSEPVEVAANIGNAWRILR